MWWFILHDRGFHVVVGYHIVAGYCVVMEYHAVMGYYVAEGYRVVVRGAAMWMHCDAGSMW